MIQSAIRADALNVRAAYVIGLVEREGRSGLAQSWVDLVLSAEGQEVLRRHGFASE